MIYELQARYDARQSFYGKAQVQEEHKKQENTYYTIIKLYSYGTLVARITTNEETLKSTCEYLGRYSQTTTRHQREFFKQFGLSDRELKELFKNGTLEV